MSMSNSSQPMMAFSPESGGHWAVVPALSWWRPGGYGETCEAACSLAVLMNSKSKTEAIIRTQYTYSGIEDRTKIPLSAQKHQELMNVLEGSEKKTPSGGTLIAIHDVSGSP